MVDLLQLLRYGRPVILTLLILFGMSCQGSSNARPYPQNFNEEEKRQTEEKIKEVENQAQFEVALPAYLPDELEHVPVAESRTRRRQKEAFVSYGTPANARPQGVPFVLGLVLIEQSDPERTKCPRCFDSSDPDSADDAIQIGEHRVAITEGQGSETGIVQDLRFWVRDTYIIMKVFWEFPDKPPGRLPDELRNEAIRIVESMVAPS